MRLLSRSYPRHLPPQPISTNNVGMFVDVGITLWVSQKMREAAAKAKPRHMHGVWYFGGSWMLQAMMVIGGVLFPALAYLSWRMHEPRWEVAAMVVLSALPWIGYPSVLSVSDLGVEQSYWWGHHKLIHWSEITELAYDPQNHIFQLSANNGLHIQHSGLNVAQPFFIRMLMHRTHLPMVQKQLLFNLQRKTNRQIA